MAWRSSPQAPGGAMKWGHIGKPILRLVVCVAAVFGVTAALYAVPLDRRPLTAALTFLCVVQIVSAIWGFRYCLFTSLLAALGFSWLLPPIGRFWLNDSRDVFALVTFLVIGITTSYLSDRARREAHNRISEQKRAEQARQEIEEQWRAAFESNPTMYFIIDEAGAIASVNAFGAEQLGYTVSELVGQPVLDVFYEPDRQAVQRHAKDCFEQPGRTLRWEARKIRKDGTMLWVRETGNAVVLKNRPVLLVVCEDITEQKRAEAAARRSENQLRDVIETMPAHVWSTLPDGALDFVNQRWQEFTGLPLEDALGWNWETVVHPDDKSRFVAEWRAALKNQQPMESEIRVRRKDGEYRWLFVRNVPLRNELGNIVKWYGTGIEIDDRKRAEALLSGEKRILEMMAKGDSLAQILDSLCRLVEEQTAGVLTSILLLDGNRLRHGGAPSLPKAYTDAIDGVVIGPSVGSCGTAAYRGEQVIVEDIATDPLWADYREAALPHSLRACWSTPVFSTQGKVMATFAMYYREPRSPSPRDQEIIEQITHLAGVVIARKLTLEALRRSEAYLAEAQKLTKTGSLAWDPVSAKTLHCSDEVFRMFGLDPQRGMPAIADLLGRVHPEDREYVTGRSRKGTDDKAEHVVDYRLLLPDGILKYIHSIRHPILNDGGEVVEFVGTIIDVTEQKRAEETMRRSETYLAEAQRLTHTGSWTWSPVTRETPYWSEEMFRIYGLDPQQGPPTNEAFWERVHPEDRDSMYELMKKAAREKTEYEHDHRIVRPEGTVKHIHAIGHPVLDRAGDVVEFVGTAVDVTERKRAEEELRRSEAYLAEAQRLTHTGSWAWEMKTLKVLYCSDEMYRIFGFDPQGGVPTAEDFEQRMHPEDHDNVHAIAWKAITQKADYVVEHRIVRPDRTVKYILTTGHPVLNGTGEVAEYFGTSADVTERKRAEEALRRSEAYLAEAQKLTHTGSCAWNMVTREVNHSSAEHSRLYGFDPELGIPSLEAIFQRVHPEDRAAAIATLERASRERTDSENDFRAVLPDGTIKYIHAVGHPFFDAAGNLVEYVGTAVDVTERKRAEEERERLRQLEADLAHIGRVTTLGELAASLAHELNQPITAAITNANTSLRWLARAEPDLDEAREAIMRIVKDGTRAAEVINRLRSFYKKGTPPQPELVDMNEVAHEMMMLLRNEANRYSIAMRTELAPKLPRVMADRVQLQQVFMNLMLNGIEAMKETGGELTIKSQSGNDGQILISVSDIGVGLPTDEADQIFNAFFTTKPQGTGMGLAITRSIIEAHGGRLWASANTGRGATFHFTLPSEATASSTSAG